MKKTNKGFTLIELLAVIVILGLIMTIAVTSIGTVIENSRVNATVKTLQSTLKGFKDNTYDISVGKNEYYFISQNMYESGATDYAWGGKFFFKSMSSIYEKVTTTTKPTCTTGNTQGSFVYSDATGLLHVCLLVKDGSTVKYVINKNANEINNGDFKARDQLES